MLSKTTLAAGVMAALPFSVLFAQDKPKLKSDPGSSLMGAVPRPPLDSSTADKKLTPPPVMRICDADVQGWCWTYTWNNGHYDGADGRGGSRSMSVESFTSESVVLRVMRSDRPGYSALNTGKISAQGDSLSGEWSDSNGGKGHITATWGAALASHPTQSQYKGPTASVNNPGAALLMGILGIGPDGSRKPADLTERISNLQRQLDAAREACTHINPHFDNGQACQANKDHAEYELSEAYGELNEEIQALQEAQKKLTAECKAGNKDSCRKLEQVNARLDKDQKFSVSSLFH